MSIIDSLPRVSYCIPQDFKMSIIESLPCVSDCIPQDLMSYHRVTAMCNVYHRFNAMCILLYTTGL